jgi:uncharacterized protein (TIGR03435 family)
MRAVHAVSLSVLASAAAFAQDPPARLEFEVASVRPSPAQRPEQGTIGLRMDGSQARITALVMRDYIAMAYRVRPSQVTGPEWIATERFDLSAKLPAGATAAQIPEMLQSLLTDRFQLKMHRDKRDVPVYALIVGKGPLKLKETPPDAAGSESPKGVVNVAGTGSAAGISVNLGNGSYYTFANNKFEAAKISMDALVRMLSAYVDRPILNLTELKGNYDLTLNLTPEDYQAMLIQAAVNNGVVLPPQVLKLMEAGSASLFDALEKAGLKLDARKAPLDQVVIDQLLKTPTEN